MPRGEERRDEAESASLEVALPIVALLVFGALALVGADFEDRAQSMRGWFFGVSGAAVTGLAGTCTLLWLRRRGRDVPLVFVLFFAVLPWLTGLAGLRWGMHRLEATVAQADWMSRGYLALRYTEASACLAYGQLLASGLLGAVAIIVGIRSVRDERPRPLLLAGMGLAMVACIGPLLSITQESESVQMLAALLAASVGLVAGLGRSGAVPAASAGLLASLGACSAALTNASFRLIDDATRADAMQRREALVDAIPSLEALQTSARIALGAMVLAASLALVASWKRMNRALVLRVLGAAVIVVGLVALDRVATASSRRSVDAWARLPWPADLELPRLSDEFYYGDEPLAVVDADGVIRIGDAIVEPESEAVRLAVAAERERREAIRDAHAEREETPEWLLEVDDEPTSGKLGKRRPIEPPIDEDPERAAAREAARRAARWSGFLGRRPAGLIDGCDVSSFPVSVAVDARADVSALDPLLAVLGAVSLHGRLGEPLPESLRAAPLLASIVERDELRVAPLLAPMRTCRPNPGLDVLLLATLGTEPMDTLLEYETGQPMTMPEGIEARLRRQPDAWYFVLVRPLEGARVQHVIDLARGLRHLTDRTEIVLVHEHPDLPSRVVLPEVIAEAAQSVRLDLGRPMGHGALGEDELHRAIEAQRGSLDQCAQRAISADPVLSAYLQAFIDVSMEGSVDAVRVVGGPAPARPLRRCLENAIAAWTFPVEAQPTEVEQRMILGEPR